MRAITGFDINLGFLPLFLQSAVGDRVMRDRVYFISISSLPPLKSFRETKDDLSLPLLTWKKNC
jgi:hypothetical protein